MHTYNPATTYIHPVRTAHSTARDHFYRLVRRVYEFGHYDYSQALYHLLEDGVPTHNITLWWDKVVRENPWVMTQSGGSGKSLHAARG